MHLPAACLALPLLAGSAFGVILGETADAIAAARVAAAAALVLVAAAGWGLLNDRPATTAGLVVGCLLAGISLGISAARSAYNPPLVAWYESSGAPGPVVLEGVLREDASPTAYGASLTLDVTAIHGVTLTPGAPGGVRLSVGGDLIRPGLQEWRAGRTVRTSASVRLPAVYLNPGVPDERRSLARRGIALVGSVKSGALVEVVAHGTRTAETAGAIRAWTRGRVQRFIAGIDSKSAGVTTAVLIGDRTGLAPDDERRMQEAGTYHVIAISGGNIAILAGLLLAGGRLLFVPARVVSVLTALALLGYGTVAVAAPSVSRAVTVAVLVLAARALDHGAQALNVLSIAAVLAAAVSPLVVVDAGFVLSFGATLGILLGMPLLLSSTGREIPARPGPMWRHLVFALKALFAATLCAELALAPVGATLFSRVPLGGLLLNFAAIPLMTLVQAGGLALLVAAPLPDAVAGAAGVVAHLAATGLLESARLVDVAPWLSADVRPPAWWLSVAYYACAAAILHPRLRLGGLAGLAAAGGLILAGSHTLAAHAVPRPGVALRVTVLDVGQGDATLVQLPGGRTLLVDAGGLPWLSSSADTPGAPPGFDVGERIVVPAVRALGADALHGLVMTHADPDHVQGIGGVLRRLRVTSLWDGVPVPPSAERRAIASSAEGHAIPWRTVQAGDMDRFGDVEVRVLHPPLPAWERQRVRNDDSIVLEVRIGVVSIVLPGDIGREGEHAILPRLERDRLVVLKAAHHGSGTSSTAELIDLLQPAAVIVSCGRDNRFGHPHPSVIARYRARGAQIFSTADDGAILVETDGALVRVAGWTGREATFAR